MSNSKWAVVHPAPDVSHCDTLAPVARHRHTSELPKQTAPGDPNPEKSHSKEKKKSRRKRSCRLCCGAEEHLTCHIVFLFSLACLCFALVTTLGPPPVGVNGGPLDPSCQPGYFKNKSLGDYNANLVEFDVCICPRETVCARNIQSVIFLVLARGSAYFDYPLYICVFLTKAKNVQCFFSRTFFAEFIPFDDLHGLHALAGVVIGFETLWHGCWHILRWSLNGEISFLWSHVTGITGAISLLLTPLIAWPMAMTCFKSCCSFEARKGLHYLSIVWGVSICFHAPATKILYIMGLAVGIYVLDYIVGMLFRTHYIPCVSIERLGEFVEVTFKTPPGLGTRDASYVYICLPWVSKFEFHAFSVVQNHDKPGYSSILMQRVGNWTRKVHRLTDKPTQRPVWIHGPFPSPFQGANAYDKIIAIASGVGITPAVNLAVGLGRSRRVNVIWMVRDPEVVEFYLKQRFYDDDGWTFIFYTGTKPFIISDRSILSPGVLLFKGRPNLPEIISAIVHSIECGVSLPDKLIARALAADQEIFYKTDTNHCREDVINALNTYTTQELFDLCVEVSMRVSIKTLSQLRRKGAGITGQVCTLEGIQTVFRRQVWRRQQELLDPSDWVALCFQNAFEGLGPGNKFIDQAGFESLLKNLQMLSSSSAPEQAKAHSGWDTIKRIFRMKRLTRRFTSSKLKTKSTREDVEEQNNAEEVKPNPYERACSGDRADIASWCAVYCGGSKPVANIIRKIGNDSGMHTEFEFFDW